MTTDQEAYDQRVLELMKQYGTLTPNKLASVTKRKHETARFSLLRLEEKGLIYSTKMGNRTYFTLMPSGGNSRYRPDTRRLEKKMEVSNDRVTRISCISSGQEEKFQPIFPLHRATNRFEMIPERGFVCYPSVTGSEVSRDFIRTHVRGEYQVKIRKIGEFKTTDYIPETDIRIRWTKKGLNGNIAMHGKIQIPQEKEAFKIRTVSERNGKFKLLSVWVHSRYIYYLGKDLAAELEFVQQVKDICDILNHFGWEFKTDSIQLVGNVHYAINDTNLATRIGRYTETDSDTVHYDQSHGIPEAEIYSELNGYKTDPETVEIMVKLPDIVKSMSSSLTELAKSVSTLTIATKETTEQVTMLQSQIMSILNVQTKMAEVITLPKQPKNDFSNEGGMYQ